LEQYDQHVDLNAASAIAPVTGSSAINASNIVDFAVDVSLAAGTLTLLGSSLPVQAISGFRDIIGTVLDDHLTGDGLSPPNSSKNG